MNDLGRVFEGVSMVPYALHGPIIAIVAVIYCVVYMGPWALVGATIILAYYPYQVCMDAIYSERDTLISEEKCPYMAGVPLSQVP